MFEGNEQMCSKMLGSNFTCRQHLHGHISDLWPPLLTLESRCITVFLIAACDLTADCERGSPSRLGLGLSTNATYGNHPHGLVARARLC